MWYVCPNLSRLQIYLYLSLFSSGECLLCYCFFLFMKCFSFSLKWSHIFVVFPPALSELSESGAMFYRGLRPGRALAEAFKPTWIHSGLQILSYIRVRGASGYITAQRWIIKKNISNRWERSPPGGTHTDFYQTCVNLKTSGINKAPHVTCDLQKKPDVCICKAWKHIPGHSSEHSPLLLPRSCSLSLSILRVQCSANSSSEAFLRWQRSVTRLTDVRSQISESNTQTSNTIPFGWAVLITFFLKFIAMTDHFWSSFQENSDSLSLLLCF